LQDQTLAEGYGWNEGMALALRKSALQSSHSLIKRRQYRRHTKKDATHKGEMRVSCPDAETLVVRLSGS
jgi:hypothetical protein